MTQARLLGGRYQVGELLGYGGMAEVHKGRDLRLGRDVAIKLLRTDLARDDTFQLRFRREAQNAASLNHPAIVAVYDTGEERGATGESLPYIVMEFVNGRTLKEVLAAEGRLMPRRALEITAEIAAALDFSHRHGIIHRDIKPGNVMLTQNGQVKVMDFGIARALASGASTMTQTSAVIGTAQYLSPEQARGESVDARSDVYATGCVLYELLCGQPPFVGDSPVSVAYQHVREDPKAPSLLNRDASPAVDAIVLKALAKNPLNRYQSAGEMRADLLRAAAGRPVYAEPVLPDGAGQATSHRQGPGGLRPVPARVGNARRRRTSGWAIAGLVALAVLAVVALVAGLIVSQQPDKVTVPDLIGKTKDEAQAVLTQNRLTPSPKPVACNQTDQQNRVTNQDTPKGTKVERGTVVAYQWCAGPATVRIPDNLIGQPADSVKQQLEALKLTVTLVPTDSEKPKDTVIGLDQSSGTMVSEGTEVKVQVSKENLKPVPTLKNQGYTAQDARAILRDGHWAIVKEATLQVNDPNLNGIVVGQDPDPGQLRDPSKQTITIIVGVYDQPTTPPVSPSGSGGPG
jgi:eukaryotic-like serine/threonine-protein kinase